MHADTLLGLPIEKIHAEETTVRRMLTLPAKAPPTLYVLLPTASTGMAGVTPTASATASPAATQAWLPLGRAGRPAAAAAVDVVRPQGVRGTALCGPSPRGQANSLWPRLQP